MKVGIAGREGSGKNEVAKYLAGQGPHHAFAFADPIYQICEDYLFMEGKDRDLLQKVGEAIREAKPRCWTDLMEYRIRQQLAMDRVAGVPHHYIVTDVRRIEEIEMLKRLDFRILYVDADPLIRRSRLGYTESQFKKAESHITESVNLEPHVDVILGNNGSPEELQEKVNLFLEREQLGRDEESK